MNWPIFYRREVKQSTDTLYMKAPHSIQTFILFYMCVSFWSVTSKYLHSFLAGKENIVYVKLKWDPWVYERIHATVCFNVHFCVSYIPSSLRLRFSTSFPEECTIFASRQFHLFWVLFGSSIMHNDTYSLNCGQYLQ